jgi:hypothetical protein
MGTADMSESETAWLIETTLTQGPTCSKSDAAVVKTP